MPEPSAFPAIANLWKLRSFNDVLRLGTMLRIRIFPGDDEGLHDHHDPGDSIDITEIPLHQYIGWESVLNELNAEHIPGWYQDGKRMGVSIADGKAHVFIYRTAKTPPESQILEILTKHGIS